MTGVIPACSNYIAHLVIMHYSKSKSYCNKYNYSLLNNSSNFCNTVTKHC